MGVAVKGGMHCPTHGPIAAETTTHGVRNTIAIVGYAATGGMARWPGRRRAGTARSADSP